MRNPFHQGDTKDSGTTLWIAGHRLSQYNAVGQAQVPTEKQVVDARESPGILDER